MKKIKSIVSSLLVFICIFCSKNGCIFAKNSGDILFIGDDHEVISEIINTVSRLMYVPDGRIKRKEIDLRLWEISGDPKELIRFDSVRPADLVVIVLDLSEQEDCIENFSYWVNYAQSCTDSTDFVVLGANCNKDEPDEELEFISKIINDYNKILDSVRKKSFRICGMSEEEKRVKLEREKYFALDKRYNTLESFKYVINIKNNYNIEKFKDFLMGRIYIIPERSANKSWVNIPVTGECHVI